MKLKLILLALLVTACGRVNPVRLPNGEQGYVIEHCGALSRCYNRAAEVCNGQYEEINQSTNFGEYSLTIRCKP